MTRILTRKQLTVITETIFNALCTFYCPLRFIIFSFRIAIEKLAQGNYFKHPLYTFCPEFSDEIVPFVNITPKTSLKKVMLSSLDIVPSDFLISVTDG